MQSAGGQATSIVCDTYAYAAYGYIAYEYIAHLDGAMAANTAAREPSREHPLLWSCR